MHITCKYARRDSAAAYYTHCVQLSTARVVNTKQCEKKSVIRWAVTRHNSICSGQREVIYANEPFRATAAATTAAAATKSIKRKK